MSKKKLNAVFSSGFTLIELLIVITIVGVLAAAIIISINPFKRQAQARDASRKSDINQIGNALKAYYAANGTYPAPSGPGASSGLATLNSSGDLKLIPVDPQGNQYQYTVSGSGSGISSAVYISLESPTSGTGSWDVCFRSEAISIGEVSSGSCVP